MDLNWANCWSEMVVAFAFGMLAGVLLMLSNGRKKK